MTVEYEKAFDWNEWFIIIALLSLSLLIVMLPKIFSIIESVAYYLFGITVVHFFDHTTSVRPWDLYDVNDSSTYQLMDFIYYVMNGPFSYIFIYFYAKFKIKGHYTFLYILIWSSFSLLIEWFGAKIGLFHYDKGYKIYWSLPIYMVIQTTLIIYYHLIQNTKSNSHPNW